MDFIEQRTAVFEAVKYGAEIVGDVGAFMGGAKSIGSDFLTKVAEGVVEVIAKAWPDVAKRMGARMSLVVNAIKRRLAPSRCSQALPISSAPSSVTQRRALGAS
jgi:hypothetical protein